MLTNDDRIKQASTGVIIEEFYFGGRRGEMLRKYFFQVLEILNLLAKLVIWLASVVLRMVIFYQLSLVCLSSIPLVAFWWCLVLTSLSELVFQIYIK